MKMIRMLFREERDKQQSSMMISKMVILAGRIIGESLIPKVLLLTSILILTNCLSSHANEIVLNPNKIDRIVIKLNWAFCASSEGNASRFFFDYSDIMFPKIRTVVENNVEIEHICNLLSYADEDKSVNNDEYFRKAKDAVAEKCLVKYCGNMRFVDCPHQIFLKVEIYSNSFRNLSIIWGNRWEFDYKKKRYNMPDGFRDYLDELIERKLSEK